jgi:hypothetical protein
LSVEDELDEPLKKNDIDKFEHFNRSEELVNILKTKTNITDDLFFRVLIAYKMGQVATMMRTTINAFNWRNIPVNVYALNLAVSGFSKGRSLSILDDEILNGFKNKFMTDTYIKLSDIALANIANENAIKFKIDIEEAMAAVKKDFHSCGNYIHEFDSGSSPALKQLITKCAYSDVGSINLVMDEVGSNLQSNKEMLTTLLETYDTGSIKSKITKNGKDNTRSEDLGRKVPCNMLLFGTPSKLLDGSYVENDFFEFLETGYARRFLFGYVSKQPETAKISARDRLKATKDVTLSLSVSAIQSYFTTLSDVTHYKNYLDIEEENALTVERYKDYCDERAEKMPTHEEIGQSEMKHRYWKALKLAGAYAFIDKEVVIGKKHIEGAIKLVEESGKAFQKMLKREKPYVKLAKYLGEIENEVTQADLVEDLPFYKGTAGQKNELLNLAIAYGYKNNIIIKKTYSDNIEFLSGDMIQETNNDELIVSCSETDIAHGFEPYNIKFDELHSLCTSSSIQHFCTHHFKDQHRIKTNALQPFNIIAIDIDGGLTISAAKDILKDYNFLLYQTAHHQKDMKNGKPIRKEDRFRILMPISHKLNLDAETYSKFMENVFEFLPFDSDEATKDISRKWLTNQIIDSSGKKVESYHYNYGKNIDALLFIPSTKKQEEQKKIVQELGSMSNLERWFALKASDGRNNSLSRFSYVLLDLGYNISDIREKVLSLNAKLKDPLSESEIDKTIMITTMREQFKREN